MYTCFRSDVLKQNIPRIEGRPGEGMDPLDFAELETKLKKSHGASINECDVMSAALYPKVAADFFKFRAKYGPVVSIQIRKSVLEYMGKFRSAEIYLV